MIALLTLVLRIILLTKAFVYLGAWLVAPEVGATLDTCLPETAIWAWTR